MITLSYGNGRTVRVPKGLSVLEASLRNNVPHASVCGGRARCSTCRIRIIGDCSVAAASRPSARPSCLTASAPARIRRSASPASCGRTTDLSFFQLFLPQITAASLRTHQVPPASARSAISSACSWTCAARPSLRKSGLPFDTVFIVNRFLGAVSQAVIECGGQPNQFVGDGNWRCSGSLPTRKPPAARRSRRQP